MLDILKIQHQRRRLNVIFGNGLRQLGVREENNPVKGRERGALFIRDRNYGHHQISRGRRGRSRRILPSRPDCLNGISKTCWKIDSRVNVRTDTQPPGHGSEPHLDFIVTDLDGMLAQLCGPDRKIIRLRDKRGIYLFIIEITAIAKYLAAPTADPGEFYGVGQTARAEFPKYAA